jgi:hypothetical protein
MKNQLMQVRRKVALIIAVTMLVCVISFAQTRRSEVLWLDFDMKNIAEPKERQSGPYDYFFKGQLIEGANRRLDVPRWLRVATGHSKQASNVNALDEVPDSSWYTNRHHIRHLDTAALQRGPNTGNPPDFTSAVITKAKTSGVSPGMMVNDATGQAYLIKFDGFNYPNLQSGAEVISTKILYAAGYNVPENYVAYIDPRHVKIGNKAEIRDPKTGKQRPLTQDDLDEMLWRVARLPDGRCRVLASKILKGKPKGPFPQIGFRSDDPNDLIPHEDRRELRALRVIASWINDWDLKEVQSLDMYVEENGRKFLRHYLLDFGSSLGADTEPTDYYHGREYGFDVHSVTKEIFSFGLYESANEKRARIISPEIGNFTNDDFDPGNWKPTYPSIMFDNLTDIDAFWAARVILSFTKEDLRNIIQTAEYSNPITNEYILRTLWERRQIVAHHWLAKTDALSDFSVRPVGQGVVLTFHDLMVERALASIDFSEYTYQVKGKDYRSPRMTVNSREITIDRETLGAATEHGSTDTPVEVSIWTHRRNFTSEPVRVYFNWSPDRQQSTIRRIDRS